MEYAQHDHGALRNPVEYRVWKSAHLCTARLSPMDRILPGVREHRLDRLPDRGSKFLAETGALILVPDVATLEVCGSLWTENELHFREGRIL